MPIFSYSYFIYLNIRKMIQLLYMNSDKLQLTQQLFQSFKAGKVIKQHNKDIVGLDFSNDGTLIYSADSTVLNVFETRTGKSYRKLFLKTLEIQQLSHTHNNQAVLVATHKNHLILYWSIHQNKVIKQFKGHTDQITNLEMCPKDDSFLSTSSDNTLRIWDLNSQSQQCRFILNVSQDNVSPYPVACFDPSGLVFGVAWSQIIKDKQISRICLYDKQKCNGGPFQDWKKEFPDIKIMKFSACGELILVATSDNTIILMDAYKGQSKYTFNNFVNQSSIIECSFTPDTKFIISGSQNGLIHVWNKEGKEVTQLKKHIQKVGFAKFSPVHCLLISGGRNLIWWLPQRKA